jgi:phosphoesterase RecJ-like protein
MALTPQSIQAALQTIEQHQRILISPHANVDPDGLSSALACYQIFTAMGKDVTVICPDVKPDSLSFLPGFEKFEHEVKENKDFVVTINLDEGGEIDKLRYTVEDNRVNIIVVPKKGTIRPQQISLSEGDPKYDLIVIVDTADLALLGSLYTDHVDLFSEVPILNIDHHISNTNYGQIQLIDPTAASATEVLYSWFTQVPVFREKITPDLATLLLTGLITDTRSFQNPNTTPRSLEVAAELLERGARQQEIIQHIYKTKPLSTLKIWGRALNHIQIDPSSRIVWSAISNEDLAEMDATSKETAGILDELISTIPDADVYVLFTELEEGGLKASMRSTAAIDVSQLSARTFGGGGHARASGFRVKAFDNFQLAVLECVQKLKDGMKKLHDDEERREQEATQPTPESKEMQKVLPNQSAMPSGAADTLPIVPKAPTETVQASKERDIVKDIMA